jgi:ribonuclease T1
VLASFLMVGVLASGAVQAKASPGTEAQASVTLAELPPQGAQMYSLIHQGGPFKHEKDGVVFGNRERLLPFQKRGFYHEYTVATPQARNRGARRIVCGGPVKAPEICYYTADHYASFRKIVP